MVPQQEGSDSLALFRHPLERLRDWPRLPLGDTILKGLRTFAISLASAVE
jgi:hypothetical protein